MNKHCQKNKATLTTSMDVTNNKIEGFKEQLNTLGTIEEDTTVLNDLTAIRDGLASQLATAKDDLENAQSKFDKQRDKVTASENNLKTATMKLDTARQKRLITFKPRLLKRLRNHQRF